MHLQPAPWIHHPEELSSKPATGDLTPHGVVLEIYHPVILSFSITPKHFPPFPFMSKPDLGDLSPCYV